MLPIFSPIQLADYSRRSGRQATSILNPAEFLIERKIPRKVSSVLRISCFRNNSIRVAKCFDNWYKDKHKYICFNGNIFETVITWAFMCYKLKWKAFIILEVNQKISQQHEPFSGRSSENRTNHFCLNGHPDLLPCCTYSNSPISFRWRSLLNTISWSIMQLVGSSLMLNI